MTVRSLVFKAIASQPFWGYPGSKWAGYGLLGWQAAPLGSRFSRTPLLHHELWLRLAKAGCSLQSWPVSRGLGRNGGARAEELQNQITASLPSKVQSQNQQARQPASLGYVCHTCFLWSVSSACDPCGVPGHCQVPMQFYVLQISLSCFLEMSPPGARV